MDGSKEKGDEVGYRDAPIFELRTLHCTHRTNDDNCLLDIGRFEINYSLPVRQDGSASKPRLSFAFGTDFL